MSSPVPFTPKPSIIDRVLGRLFPTDQYGGLLAPTQQKALQRQGLLQLGTGLLADTGPGNALSALGRSYQGIDFGGMADHALKLQAYRAQKAQDAEIRNIVDTTTGETPYERLQNIAGKLAGIPGTEHLTGPLSSVLDALKPTGREMGTHVVPLKDGIYLVRNDGTKLRIGPPPDKAPKEPTPAERVAGSQLDSASESVASMREIAQRNPAAVQQALAALKASKYGVVGRLSTEARGLLSDPDAQNFYTNYKNMILTVTPTYGGARPTQQLMDLEEAASLPALGSGDFETAFRHMQDRLADLRAKAGHAIPALPKEEPKKGPRHPENPY